VVYNLHMGRTNVVVDDELIAKAMELYEFRTKREAIDYALRRLVGGVDDPYEAALALEGIGWAGDLDEMRSGDPIEEF
jgi:Arc/MetJ family transcription regulator